MKNIKVLFNKITTGYLAVAHFVGDATIEQIEHWVNLHTEKITNLKDPFNCKVSIHDGEIVVQSDDQYIELCIFEQHLEDVSTVDYPHYAADGQE